jgi:hypothetical protein
MEIREQASANADVSRAQRFLAEGDEKYRSKDYAGAAVQYRRAASIFDSAMAVLAEDEVEFDDNAGVLPISCAYTRRVKGNDVRTPLSLQDACHVLAVLRDSHLRKAERLEGIAHTGARHPGVTSLKAAPGAFVHACYTSVQ